MGLINFFRGLINKITGKELQKLPPPSYVQNSILQTENNTPQVEKNAYVEAYTKKINNKKSDFRISEDGTRFKFLDQKADKPVEVQKITKIKENFSFNDIKIDIYKGIYAAGTKENREIKKVYFALPAGKAILDLYKGSSKKASLKTKLKTLFSVLSAENRKCFLGVVLEDEIYNDFRLVRSNKLEEYIIELEKKKQIIKKNKEKSKEQVTKTIVKKDAHQKIKANKEKIEDAVEIEKIKPKTVKTAKTKKLIKTELKINDEVNITNRTKELVKTLNKVRALNEQKQTKNALLNK